MMIVPYKNVNFCEKKDNNGHFFTKKHQRKMLVMIIIELIRVNV